MVNKPKALTEEEEIALRKAVGFSHPEGPFLDDASAGDIVRLLATLDDVRAETDDHHKEAVNFETRLGEARERIDNLERAYRALACAINPSHKGADAGDANALIEELNGEVVVNGHTRWKDAVEAPDKFAAVLEEVSRASGREGEETPCPKRDDGTHCHCWYDLGRCCGCGANDPAEALQTIHEVLDSHKIVSKDCSTEPEPVLVVGKRYVVHDLILKEVVAGSRPLLEGQVLTCERPPHGDQQIALVEADDVDTPRFFTPESPGWFELVESVREVEKARVQTAPRREDDDAL